MSNTYTYTSSSVIKARRETVQKLLFQCESCLTCAHTKKAYGNKLYCEHKAHHYVNQDSVCADHKSMAGKGN